MSVYERHVNILKSNSFFLFGARGTGQNALLKAQLSLEQTLCLDLLIQIRIRN